LVNGRLETDAEAYGSLSIMYCSKVLHAYQDYKFKVLFKVREELQKIENTKPKPINKDERFLILKNYYFTQKKLLKKKSILMLGI
jgi:hypothetical protein